jgi:hypothetical protein
MAVLACGAVGCGVDHLAVCEEAEKCRDGNEADVEACVELGELEHDMADVRGCGSEYEVWFDCYAAEASCDGPTQNYGLRDPNLCEAEGNAYQQCT